MDKLDTLIVEKKQHVERLQLYVDQPGVLKDDLQKATHELRTFEKAAALRPASRSAGAEPRKSKKPEGAISLKWRSVMRVMVRTGNRYQSASEIAQLATKRGLNATPNRAAYRFGRYQVFGFVERNENYQFRITRKAIDRFKLEEPEKN